MAELGFKPRHSGSRILLVATVLWCFSGTGERARLGYNTSLQIQHQYFDCILRARSWAKGGPQGHSPPTEELSRPLSHHRTQDTTTNKAENFRPKHLNSQPHLPQPCLAAVLTASLGSCIPTGDDLGWARVGTRYQLSSTNLFPGK